MKILDEYVKKMSSKDHSFKQEYEKLKANSEAAALVRELRANTGLSQREFAKLVGKPQSTISKIESANMNISTGLLSEIGAAVGKKLQMQFV